MVRFCGLSATLGAFRLGALPAIVRRSSSGQSGGGRGIGGSSFPFRSFRSAPSGKGRSLGAPREPSRAGGLGRVAGFRRVALAARGRGPVAVVGGAAWGPRGLVVGGAAFGGPRGPPAGGLGPFPFGTASFALFGPKSQVFPATFAGLSGELPASKRRRPRRPFVTKFAVSSPFAAGAFSFLITREGALAGALLPPARSRHFATSPWKSSPLRRAKVPGPALHRFAVEKSDQTTRLSHFALAKFTASPRKSPPPRPVFRFAVLKSTRPPGFRASPWRSPTKPPGFRASSRRSSPLRRGKVHHPTRFFASPW